MAVASPYAVFRAVDVIWPPQAPSVEAEAHHVPTAAAPVRGAVQGELFPVVAGMPGGSWV
jgi:hypothetical protein